MDIVAIRTALRGLEAPAPESVVAVLHDACYEACHEACHESMPVPADQSPVEAALLVFEHAVRRHARAEAEAAVSSRPSTLKATLKTATAVRTARAELLAVLRVEPSHAEEPALRLVT